eukprot:CAMPEP_0177687614 /NCGR_PEP_ID=MMETSP0447-20121125/34221_1 /TAXON_ID=0 /ORGANISM="Stygamoeba regulata, Strain BSH-02190019" /LENGTH=684 /DNA_ID=CAMNT_0019197865 /DNA_START=140 /DNA_END=2195 /DNA_ORIENTATION=-
MNVFLCVFLFQLPLAEVVMLRCTDDRARAALGSEHSLRTLLSDRVLCAAVQRSLSQLSICVHPPAYDARCAIRLHIDGVCSQASVNTTEQQRDALPTPTADSAHTLQTVLDQVRLYRSARSSAHLITVGRHGTIELDRHQVRGWLAAVADQVPGMSRVLNTLQQRIESVLLLDDRPRSPARADAAYGQCVLLTGPSGSGKSLLARSLAACAPAALVSVHHLRGPAHLLDAQAAEEGEVVESGSSLLVLDELGALCPPAERTSLPSRRISALLGELLDRVATQRVLVIGMASSIGSVDARLLRGGRLALHLAVPVPDAVARTAILARLCRALPLLEEGAEQRTALLERVAARTAGLLGAELQSLTRQATMCAIRDQLVVGDLSALQVDWQHFARVLNGGEIQPAALAAYGLAGSARLQDHYSSGSLLEQMVGADEAVQRLCTHLIDPLKRWQSGDGSPVDHIPHGVLIYGPSGTGKTMLSQAISQASGIRLISTSAGALLSPVVGESERKLCDLFAAARQAAPCFLLLDGLEALAPARGGAASRTSERVLSCFLTELDGVVSASSSAEPLVVIGTTTHRSQLDRAILRPGRLDLQVELHLPNVSERVTLLRAHADRLPLSERLSSDCETILRSAAERLVGASQSDLENVWREAAMLALREDVHSAVIDRIHVAQGVDLMCSRLKR